MTLSKTLVHEYKELSITINSFKPSLDILNECLALSIRKVSALCNTLLAEPGNVIRLRLPTVDIFTQ